MITIYKFYLDRTEDLTTQTLGKLLERFEYEVKPQLVYYKGYYAGTGQAIMKRVMGDPSKPNNKIVKNYCASIVDNFQGYLTGKPITFIAEDDIQNELLQDINKNNDEINADSEFLSNALTYGIAYQLCYVNENKEKKYKNIPSECVIPVYANDLDEELLYVVYYYKKNDWQNTGQPERYSVNVYDKNEILHYECGTGFKDFTPAADVEVHYFGQVPWVIFNLNKDNSPIFERIISMQDAYNQTFSDEVNDFQAFVDAYMVLKNVKADAEDLAAMKESRTILIDGEDSVEYLTKDYADTQVQNILDNLNSSIHTIANSPDFSSEEFQSGVSSGIALQFKLIGFNNIASNIEAQFEKALQKRIALLNNVFELVDTTTIVVDIIFTHNLPSSVADTVEMVNGLRGLVSDETLLSQIPFIDNVADELSRIEGQNRAFSELYSFNHTEGE